MPKEIQIRPNVVARQNTNSPAVGTSVHQSLNVQAEQVNFSGIQKGLSTLNNFYEKKRQRKDAERIKIDNLSFEQGKLGASTGSIDQERFDLGEDEAYLRGVNSQFGVNEAMQQSGDISAAYEAAFKDDPNLDVEGFLAQAASPSPENIDNIDYLTSYNKGMSQISNVIRRQHAANLAKAQDEQIFNLGVGRFDALVEKSKMLKTDLSVQDFKNEWNAFDELGLDNDEKTKILVDGALHQASRGNYRAAETALEFLEPNKVSMGKFGRQLKDSVEIGKQREELELSQQKNYTEKQKALYRTQVDTSIRNGNWGIDQSLQAVEAGIISAAQHESDLKRFRNQLGDEHAKAIQIAQFQHIDNDPDAYHAFDKDTQKAYIDHAESSFQGITNDLVDLYRNMTQDMPEEQKAEHLMAVGNLIQDNRQAFESMQRIGHTPNSIKGLFGSATIDAPQFDKAANMYKALEATLGSRAYYGVPQENIAQFRQYNRMVGTLGHTPEEAKLILTDKTNGNLSRNITEFKTAIGGKIQKEIGKRLTSEDLLGSNVELSGQSGFFNNDIESDSDGAEIRLTSRIQEEITLRAAIEYKYSGDADTALETAIQDFKNESMVIRGGIIPREHIPDQFPIAFEGYQDVIHEKLKSGDYNYDGDADLSSGFTAIPIDTSTLDGRMVLVPVNDRSEFLTNKDGDLITINPSRTISFMKTRDDTARTQEEKDVFEAAKVEKEDKRKRIENLRKKGFKSHL